jgi:predicted permease
VLAYLLSYHRYRRLLLEGKPGRPKTAAARGIGPWLLERWMPDPRQQAAFSFIWKTLARSRSHRLILLAYAGIAIGAITKGALDMPRPSLHDQGLYGLVVVLAPLALSLLATAGMRYLFNLPDSPRANWIFQTNDRDGGTAWLLATERFVVWCGIAPLFVAALPATIAILGWMRAVAVSVLTFCCALVWFEALFRRWRKLPFTCTYLPGKQPVWLILVRYAFASAFVGPAGQLILYCSSEPIAFVALFTFELALLWRWHGARHRAWSACDLCYEENPDVMFMTLGLKQPLSQTPSPPRQAAAVEAAAFQPTLLRSGGVLPEAWRQEIHEESRHPGLVLRTFLEDIRFAGRLIRRNPLLSAVVVLTLTVGIGINASIFTVVSAVALRPHVARDPDSFLRIFPITRLQGTPRAASFGEYAALRDQTQTLRQIAAFSYMGVMMGEEDTTEYTGLTVSCNFFAVEGLDRPILGRLLTRDDCNTPGQLPVAVIDESVWHTRFASDRNIVGRMVRINSRPVVVAGVVPGGTSRWVTARTIAVWLPYTAITYFEPSHDVFHRDDLLTFDLAGRLRPGYTRDQAQVDMRILEQRQDRIHSGRRTTAIVTDGSWSAEMDLRASTRDLMLMGFFFATFNLVLFIACANVATLLLSRAAARRREIAVRLALGVPRVRLLRMLITESLLLAAFAGAASFYLAWHVPKPLYTFLSPIPPDFPMAPDWRTFAYIAAVVTATGILAGLAPALESLKVDLTSALKGSPSGAGMLLGGGSAGTRLRGLLVSAQVALSMVLLVEAGLFARTEQRALSADPGYAPGKVVVAYLRFPDNSKPETAPARLDAIAQRIERLPGVRSVAFSDELPLLRPQTVELRPPSRRDASQPVDVYTASIGFFATLGLPVVRGREFRESDASAAVVSQSLAKALWPRQDAIGKMLPLPAGALPIVGVVRDIDPMRLGGSENPPVYRLRHADARHNVMSVRFDTDVSAGARAIRAAIRESDPALFVYPLPLQKWIDRITANLWNVASLIVVLGVVATVLATTGIYGAVSFAVNQRTREMGIRVALGATRSDIIREVLLSGGKPVLHGLIVGLWLAVPTAAGLRESVRGSPLRLDNGEPLLYAAAAILLAAAAVLAMLGPARRGANSDPLDALRCE